jgi:hypothetical protein
MGSRVSLMLRLLGQWLQHRKPHVGPLHLILCICDHWEPGYGHATPAQADARVDAWVKQYPRQFGRFLDSDGRPPRHTFFYPLEMYRASELDGVAELCRSGYGEVEVHLHHDNDSSDRLRETLLKGTRLLSERHGLLARDAAGQTRYAFIHGNWALDNSSPDGRWCGVNDELDVLRETGCYADFTFPSYPSPTQTRKINSIYYAVDDPQRPKSHDTGIDVGLGRQPADSLMLVQGPLLLNWSWRRFWSRPRVENGNLQRNQPPTARRLDLWLRARVRVSSRPEWVFVKLYTHGAPEHNAKIVLGEPMVRFHQLLAQRAANGSDFKYHYVTAREMYNLIKAAEGSRLGEIDELRDCKLTWPDRPV